MQMNNEKSRYMRSNHPLAEWVNSSLRVEHRLTSYEERYPHRVKPRQPNDILNLIQLLPGPTTGVMALKRDGWFLSIRISETDLVQYFTLDDKEYDLNGLLDVDLLRQQFPQGLQMIPLVIHAEIYVVVPNSAQGGGGVSGDDTLEAGAEVMGQALARWKTDTRVRNYVRVSAFRLHTLGYMGGARFNKYSNELVLLNRILKDQSRVKVVEYTAIEVLSNNEMVMKAFRVGSAASETGAEVYDTETMGSALVDIFLNEYRAARRATKQADGIMTVQHFFDFMNSVLERRGFEGAIITFDAGNKLPFKDRFKKDYSGMYRAQYQIKYKQMFSGVFKVDPISHCISDSRDRICGYLAEVYHEKGFFKALKATQSGGLVKLTCPWISASKDLFEDANKYCLTGIKYVRIQDICKDGPCADIATLCSDSPR